MSFLTWNHCECHPLLEMDRRISGYAPARLLRRWMLAHPTAVCSSCYPTRLLTRLMAKRYRHRSKWGLIPKNPSHKVTYATMCWIPLGVRCCSST